MLLATESRLQLLIRARGKRENLIAAMERDSFPAQLRFINDPSRLKAALTTRRAGKSMSAALDLVRTGVKYPGCNAVYIALTRENAKRILKKDCLDATLDKYEIQNTHNGLELVTRLTKYNSRIYMLGADSSKKEMEKALGSRNRLIYVDESASYSIDLESFVYKYLRPTTADEGGTIGLIGTPGNNTYCFFKKVTDGLCGGWSVHRWNSRDNPYMTRQWAEEVAEIKRDRPEYLATAAYRQMYLGEWAIDETKLVYAYNEELNCIESFRPLEGDPVHHVLGIDLGFEDDSAFALLGYTHYSRHATALDIYKRSGMTISDVEAKIRYYLANYAIEDVIIDNASKQAVQELNQRLGLQLTPAEKIGKSDFIAILNDDLRQGKIKLVRSRCQPLIDEWQALVWDEGKYLEGKREEYAGCANHVADAFLYAWRRCFHWVDHGPHVEKPKTPEQQAAKFWADESADAQDERNRPEWEGW